MRGTLGILLWLALATVAHADQGNVAAPACAEVGAARFVQAQTLYRSGQFVRALPITEQLSACYPDNVDYQFLRALTLNALGRSDDALAVALLARKLAPDYTELSDFIERLRAAQTAESSQPTSTPAIDDMHGNEGELSSPADTGPATTPAMGVPADRWSIIGAAGVHLLTDGRDNWSEASLSAFVEKPDGRIVEVGVDHESRGDATDTSLRGNAVWPLGEQRRISAGLILTPSATFRPEQIVMLQLEQDLPDGWVVRASANHRSFSDDQSQGLLLSVDRYYSAFRFSVGVNLARLDSAGNAASQVASVDWYRSARNRFRLTFGTGKELDTIADGTRVLESRVRSVTITGFHELNPRLALGWWLGTLEQGDFYDRHYAGFSVTRRY